MERDVKQTQTPRQTAPAPDRTGIPIQMKLDLERRGGLPLDEVRVHYNSDRPARLGALAYTYGSQVYLGPGQERHLRHELGHVIQQKRGLVRPTATVGGLPLNDEERLERQADELPLWRPAGGEGAPVVQKMPLPDLLHQNAPNCGFHALARAMMGVAGFVDPGLPDSLTAFAARQGLTLVGEAFDPVALVAAGNGYCAGLAAEAGRLRGVTCELTAFDSPEALSRIFLENQAGAVLVPYFDGPDCDPVVNQRSEKAGAHWAAIDPTPQKVEKMDEPCFEMYEGNHYGVLGEQESPALVSAQELYDSNQSIKEEFDWVGDYYVDMTSREAFLQKPKEEQAEEAQWLFREEWITYRDAKQEPPPLAGAVTDRTGRLDAVFGEETRRGHVTEAAGKKREEVLKKSVPSAPIPGLNYSAKERVFLRGMAVVVKRGSGGGSGGAGAGAGAGPPS